MALNVRLLAVFSFIVAVSEAQDFYHRGVERAEGLDSILNIEDSDKKQYLDQNFNASTYDFGYEIGPSGQFHHEDKGPDGIVYGCYGYVDPFGKLSVTHYLSDGWGYRTVTPGRPVELFLHPHDPSHENNDNGDHGEHAGHGDSGDNESHSHHHHHGVITPYAQLHFPRGCGVKGQAQQVGGNLNAGSGNLGSQSAKPRPPPAVVSSVDTNQIGESPVFSPQRPSQPFGPSGGSDLSGSQEPFSPPSGPQGFLGVSGPSEPSSPFQPQSPSGPEDASGIGLPSGPQGPSSPEGPSGPSDLFGPQGTAAPQSPTGQNAQPGFQIRPRPPAQSGGFSQGPSGSNSPSRPQPESTGSFPQSPELFPSRPLRPQAPTRPSLTSPQPSCGRPGLPGCQPPGIDYSEPSQAVGPSSSYTSSSFIPTSPPSFSQTGFPSRPSLTTRPTSSSPFHPPTHQVESFGPSGNYPIGSSTPAPFTDSPLSYPASQSPSNQNQPSLPSSPANPSTSSFVPQRPTKPFPSRPSAQPSNPSSPFGPSSQIKPSTPPRPASGFNSESSSSSYPSLPYRPPASSPLPSGYPSSPSSGYYPGGSTGTIPSSTASSTPVGPSSPRPPSEFPNTAQTLPSRPSSAFSTGASSRPSYPSSPPGYQTPTRPPGGYPNSPSEAYSPTESPTLSPPFSQQPGYQTSPCSESSNGLPCVAGQQNQIPTFGLQENPSRPSRPNSQPSSGQSPSCGASSGYNCNLSNNGQSTQPQVQQSYEPSQSNFPGSNGQNLSPPCGQVSGACGSSPASNPFASATRPTRPPYQSGYPTQSSSSPFQQPFTHSPAPTYTAGVNEPSSSPGIGTQQPYYPSTSSPSGPPAPSSTSSEYHGENNLGTIPEKPSSAIQEIGQPVPETFPANPSQPSSSYPLPTRPPPVQSSVISMGPPSQKYPSALTKPARPLYPSSTPSSLQPEAGPEASVFPPRPFYPSSTPPPTRPPNSGFSCGDSSGFGPAAGPGCNPTGQPFETSKPAGFTRPPSVTYPDYSQSGYPDGRPPAGAPSLEETPASRPPARPSIPSPSNTPLPRPTQSPSHTPGLSTPLAGYPSGGPSTTFTQPAGSQAGYQKPSTASPGITGYPINPSLTSVGSHGGLASTNAPEGLNIGSYQPPGSDNEPIQSPQQPSTGHPGHQGMLNSGFSSTQPGSFSSPDSGNHVNPDENSITEHPDELLQGSHSPDKKPYPVYVIPFPVNIVPSPSSCPCYLVTPGNDTSSSGPHAQAQYPPPYNGHLQQGQPYGVIGYIPVVFYPYCPGNESNHDAIQPMFPTAVSVPYPCNQCGQIAAQAAPQAAPQAARQAAPQATQPMQYGRRTNYQPRGQARARLYQQENQHSSFQQVVAQANIDMSTIARAPHRRKVVYGRRIRSRKIHRDDKV